MSIRKTCGDCHDVDAQAKSLHFNKSEPHPDPETSDCLSCHLPKKNAFTPDGKIKRAVAEPLLIYCVDCHSDVAEQIAQTAHGRPDKRVGDHPTCITCHSGDPHNVKLTKQSTRKSKTELCSSCHRQEDLLRRYGRRPGAVESYEQSFHGKALVRFGQENSAGCADCHGYHDIVPLAECVAKGDSVQLVKTCSKCHPGAKMNFCMSGASHLRLKMERSLILTLEDIFFKALTIGVMALLLFVVALDLRVKVFGPHPAPRSGRVVAGFVAASYCAMVIGLALAVWKIGGSEWAWTTAVALMAAAFVAYVLRRKPTKANEKTYLRFNLSFRLQHICLAASFVVLVLTGMPLKFAHVGWSHHLHLLFGGFSGARIAHRVAAIIMTATWLWHGLYLLYLWKKAGFTLSSWTMWPSKKDFTDFLDTIKYSLGLRHEPPRYGRFSWKEKFDYFAVYWGMPIMVLSGLVLWFPVFFGNRLTDHGLAIAYIAHSDEALLAFLAILMWHLYNTHFDPEHFPMSPVWLTGTLTESEMEREHPLEKAELESRNSKLNSNNALGSPAEERNDKQSSTP